MRDLRNLLIVHVPSFRGSGSDWRSSLPVKHHVFVQDRSHNVLGPDQLLL